MDQPDPLAELADTARQIRIATRQLARLTNQRDQQIIRALQPRRTAPTLQQIAEAAGLSREWVRNIEQKHRKGQADE